MSLAVKKAISDLEPKIQYAKNAVAEMVGGPIDIEFAWDTFTDPSQVSILDGNCLQSIMGDLNNMCRDTVVKDGVRDGVKKIRIMQDNNSKGEMSLDDKVLTLKTEWVNNYFGGLQIKEFLMSHL